MTKIRKRQIIALIFLLIITPIGFMTKFYSGPAHHWVSDSFGGLLYEIFWCLVLFFIFPKSKPLKIAIWVLIITCILEFLQLWHPPFLEVLRSNFIGRTILGNSFNWKDFPYYFLGSLTGYLILVAITRLIFKTNSPSS